jgi:uncharacterized DUF497 family protein
MIYEWDLEKSWKNLMKPFEQAVLAVEDPYGLFVFDQSHSETEDRYIVIGNSEGLVLFVNVVEPDENTTRIISARPAKTHEKESYYENCSLHFGKPAETD